MLRKLFFVLYQPYKWIVYIPLFAINTLFFGVMAVLFSILINKKVGSFIGGVIWARFNAIMVPMFVSVKGKENIIKGQSYIIVSNHRSYYDIFTIYGWIGLDIKWIMKKELGKIPGLGFGAKKVGHIFIDRSNPRAALESMNEAKRILTGGTSAVIFPEGTRNKEKDMLTFKRGGFKMALDLGLPILPVTLLGTQKILPADSLNIMPGCVKMIVHKPIDITGYTEENMKDLMEVVRGVIEEGL